MKLFGKKNDLLKKIKDSETEKEKKFGQYLDFASKEAYNLLRTNIFFSIPDKQGKGKVIGITSSVPHEGKSYTAINLAYTIAKEGHKTLLVNADLRKPSIEKVLNIKAEEGLSNLLIGENKNPIVQVKDSDNLYLLPAGRIPPNPSELLGKENMKNLLSEYAEEYAYVIVDLPPVNVVADGLVVSKFTDGMVVIVRHGLTRRKELVEAIKKLTYVQAHILGVVYNGYNHSRGKSYYKGSYYKYGKNGKYGYGDKYGYGYGYGSPQKPDKSKDIKK